MNYLSAYFIRQFCIFFSGLTISKITYDHRTKTCIFDREDWIFPLYISITVLLFPTVVSAVCYVKIYLMVKRSKEAIEKHQQQKTTSPKTTSAGATGHTGHSESNENQMMSTTLPPPLPPPPSKKSSARQSMTRFLVFLTFLLMYSPYALVTVLDPISPLPDLLHGLAALILCANSMVNPIIYGIMNKSFRNSYIAIIRRLLPCLEGTRGSGRKISVEPFSATT